jgi:glutaminyl-tRNA synthetase
MYSAHPHSGDKWCIYPTYDFTHNIVDSLENITHSLCTLEFELRQAAYGPYYWLLDELDMYKPVTWEYSRCNIEYNVLSKRRLNCLVTDNHVNGWDDPRLLTISGMMRRGYSADAVNKFCAEIGVTRSANWSKMELLEGIVRNELDDSAPRAFAIMDAIKVTISNHPGGEPEVKEVPVHPKRPEMGNRQLPFTKTVYIDRSDFREEDEAGYFGMAPGKEVKLLFAYNIRCDDVKKENGVVTEVVCTYDPNNTNKVKGNLSWLPDNAVPAEVRLYGRLFVCPQPGSGGAPAAADDEDEEEEPADSSPQWLKDVNPNSLIVQPNALVEASVGAKATTIGQTFQFVRIGYFVIDNDSTASKVVLNRIVSLRESK